MVLVPYLIYKIGTYRQSNDRILFIGTAIAISIGLGLSNLLEPGVGLSSTTQEILRSSHSETIGVKITQAVAPDLEHSAQYYSHQPLCCTRRWQYAASSILLYCLRDGGGKLTR